MPEPDFLPLQVNSLRFEAAGKPLLNDVSFSLDAGRPTCVVGPNGAGKSLLLRLCHGLLAPSGGSIRWAGGTVEQQRRAQAMVFQRPVLLRRSVRANIEHALSTRQLLRSERTERTEAVLEKTGLSDLAERDARVLSGGEQQRLALARAWALRPRMLFLDEPTAHLDPAATASVEAIIRDIDSEGVRILMVSHDLGQVRRMAGDVLFLHNGRLIAHTDTRSFLDAPESELTCAFVEGRLLW
tara:strand:- start:7447 stop:8169 length:723 start_codon:yes stop_codon:yes gene_type:complete